MKEQSTQLKDLLENLPSYNTSTGYSQLNSVLSKYTTILDYVNSYSDEFKSSTTVYYSDITNIRDEMQISLYASLQEQKVAAFEKASNELRSNIQALASLIQGNGVTVS